MKLNTRYFSIVLLFEYRDLSNSQNIREIYALHYNPNSEWSDPVLIETEPSHSAHRPGIELDKYGNGIAFWLEWDRTNQNQSIHVNRFVVGSGWGIDHAIAGVPWGSAHASLSVLMMGRLSSDGPRVKLLSLIFGSIRLGSPAKSRVSKKVDSQTFLNFMSANIWGVEIFIDIRRRVLFRL